MNWNTLWIILLVFLVLDGFEELWRVLLKKRRTRIVAAWKCHFCVITHAGTFEVVAPDWKTMRKLRQNHMEQAHDRTQVQ